MLQKTVKKIRPLYVPVTALLVASLAGCMSAGERRSVNLHEDSGTCATFGSDYGSRAYSDCMLAQQQRRDTKSRNSLEEVRLTSQIAKDAQIMGDRARKQRCDRDPDRSECGRRKDR